VEGRLFGKTPLDGLRWIQRPENWPSADPGKVVKRRTDYVLAKVIDQVERDMIRRRDNEARLRTEKIRKERSEMFKAKGW